MKIAIGSDHAGFEYKEKIHKFLRMKGYEVLDVGTENSDAVDYPVYADKVSLLVEDMEVDFGILICGTGIGMSMAANKHKKIRAAVCADLKSAEFTRLHNDANILCLGERIISYELVEPIIERFLTTEFIGGKHKIRIDMFS